jgi:hypothetical protein
MSFDIGISGQYFYPVSISSHPSFAKTQMTPKEVNSGRKPSPRYEVVFLSIEKTVGA